MRTLVIGYGSIGSRHASILNGLGCAVTVVSRREQGDYAAVKTIEEALGNSIFDYVVVSNRTSEHFDALRSIVELGYSGTVLIEKPLFDRYDVLNVDVESDWQSRTYVAYNLRFHPLIQKLREALVGETILTVQAYVGQYLPDWRPSSDYKQSYSADRHLGGGVLLDLSHELDFLTWLFGRCRRVAAVGGQISSLQINSDDAYAMILQTEQCPYMTLQMNYLDRITNRYILVNTESKTIFADLIHQVFRINDKSIHIEMDRNGSYTSMHTALLGNRTEDVCTYRQGLDILQLIQSIEMSSHKGEWVDCG